MTFKKFGIILILILFLLPITKIYGQNSNTKTSGTVSAVENVKNIIANKTPDIIAKPIVVAANTLEVLRANINKQSVLKTEESKKNLEDIKKLEKTNPNTNKFTKYLKYLEVFFFQIVSFISGNIYAFYIFLLIISYFIVRFIWRKIF
jgi:hypothetical protein